MSMTSQLNLANESDAAGVEERFTDKLMRAALPAHRDTRALCARRAVEESVNLWASST
jgi:hypothetical protein